jgi:hypothetical protein
VHLGYISHSKTFTFWHARSEAAKWFVSAARRCGISGGFWNEKRLGTQEMPSQRHEGSLFFNGGIEYITLTAGATPSLPSHVVSL